MECELPERRAAIEGVRVDPGDAGGNMKLRKRCAVFKGPAADAGDAVRDGDLRQGRTAPECAYTDGCDGVSAQRIGQKQIAGAAGIGGDGGFAVIDGVGKVSFGFGN